MSHAPEYPLTHKLGDSFDSGVFYVRFKQRESDADPWIPLDLTGCEVEFSLGRKPGASSGWIKYHTADVIPRAELRGVVEGADTWWEWHPNILPAVTREWSKMRAYELTVEFAGGRRVSYLGGSFEPHLEVAP